MLSSAWTASCRKVSFSFWTRSYSAAASRNQAIIELLNKRITHEEIRNGKDGYKIRSYRNAVRLISALDYPLQTQAEALTLKGISKHVAVVIGEFLSGKEDAQSHISPLHLSAKAQLMRMPGIGATKAEELIRAGCTSPADVENYSAMLTKTQRVGAKYFYHLLQPVSRQEVETVAEFIRDNLPSNYELTATGSYRRGQAGFEEMEFIFLHPSHIHVPIPTVPPPFDQLPSRVLNTNTPVKYVSAMVSRTSPLHSTVVPHLTERGLLAAPLRMGDNKWEGVLRIPQKNENGWWQTRMDALAEVENGLGTYRKVNLHMIPVRSKSAALIAYTGDKELNKFLRRKAMQVGMHLNEYGLWEWTSHTDKSKPEDNGATNRLEEMEEDGKQEEKDDRATGFWRLVRTSSEQEIFQHVGVEYVEPHRRNFGFLQNARRRKN